MMTSPLTCAFLTAHMRTFDQNYNVEPETRNCLELIDEIIDFLIDIRLALELEEDLMILLHPHFDPFRTIGKYC